MDAPNFEVLLWWKANQAKFPVLAKMARDILAIPISSVASESVSSRSADGNKAHDRLYLPDFLSLQAFSTGRRVLTPYRSRLDPAVVSALLCCQSWLREQSMEVLANSDKEDDQ